MDVSVILEIRRGSQVKEYPLTQQLVTIGRGDDNQIILDDNLTSRHHAVVGWAGGMPRVTDLGSSNGTLVNGIKIEPEVPVLLKEGDVINIGDFTINVRLRQSAEKEPVSLAEERTSTLPEKIPFTIVGERAVVPPPARVEAPERRKSSLLGIIVTAIVVLVAIAAIAAIVMFLVPMLMSGDYEDIRVGFVGGLRDLNEKALEQINAEIADIDQQLYETEERILKLAQVVTPAQEWVELQEDKAKDRGYTWVAHMTAEGLDKLKNDTYQVTTLRGQGTSSGEFNAEIKVTDLTAVTQAGRDWKDIDDELIFLKSALEKRKQEKVVSRDLAVSTLQSVISYQQNWEIKKINSTTYNFSGPRLGWEGDLTNGKWTYLTDTGEARPIDDWGSALKKVLLGKP